MRRVEILTTCDACAVWDGAEVSRGVETVPVGGGHTLDLCESHRRNLGATLALIAEWASPPEEAPRNRRGGRKARARRERAEAAVEPVEAEEAAPSGVACPICGHSRATSAGVAAHLRSAHHTTSEAIYGLLCPLCGEEFTRSNGLGRHALGSHEAEGVATLFARALDEGDPLGIVAGRAAAIAAAASTD